MSKVKNRAIDKRCRKKSGTPQGRTYNQYYADARKRGRKRS